MTKNYCWLIVFLLLVNFAKAGVTGHIKPVDSTLNFHTDDCPQIIADNVVIMPSACNAATGKIVGMSGTGTGTLHYTWFNSNKVIVGNDADLINIPSGTYYVQLRDDSKCKAVISIDYIVGGITIDNTHTVYTSSTCNNADGSITNISITNATKYQWTDAQNNPVSSTPDLKNVAAGYYTLTVSNNTGCLATSNYTVTSGTYFPALIKVDTVPAYCNGTGSFALTFAIKDTDPNFTYTLLKQNDPAPVTNGVIAYNPDNPGETKISLQSLAPGITYILYITDQNGCRMQIVLVLGAVVYRIDDSNIVIHDDYCGQNIGAITSLKVIGRTPGFPAPNEYIWTDKTGKIVSGQIFLGNQPAGTYRFTATDAMGCTDTREYTINDITSISTPPQANDIKLCLPGAALIEVTNSDGGGYNLYDSSQALLTSNKVGMFPVNVKVTSTYYITHTNGTCESAKVPVTVTVDAPDVEIPNTFTPNNDGVNDRWNIKGIEQFPYVTVDIYTRYGQLIYHSDGYAKPFDGTNKQKQLPVGAYYYIIDVHKPACLGKLTGSVTIIR